MSLTIHLPPSAEEAFRRAWGEQLDRKAFEALLLEGYRTQTLSRYEVQQLLGFDNRWDTEEWLGQHGAEISYSLQDLEADRTTLDRILAKDP